MYKRRAELKGHRDEVQVLRMLPNYLLASGSKDNTIKIWNYEKAELIHSLQGHTENILCIELLPDNEIATGSSDNTVRVWNYQTGKLKFFFSIYFFVSKCSKNIGSKKKRLKLFVASNLPL